MSKVYSDIGSLTTRLKELEIARASEESEGSVFDKEEGPKIQ